jgi:hypothetical protein
MALVVNIAAARAPFGQYTRARSGLPDFFTPQCSPVAKNPFGAVIVSLVIFCNSEEWYAKYLYMDCIV